MAIAKTSDIPETASYSEAKKSVTATKEVTSPTIRETRQANIME